VIKILLMNAAAAAVEIEAAPVAPMFNVEVTFDGGSELHIGLTARSVCIYAEERENEGGDVRVFATSTGKRVSVLTVLRLALGEIDDI
jgi:hypothetical protein